MASVKGGNSSGPSNVAIDTVASEDFQRVKLVDGTIGSSTAVGTAANPLRVDPTGTTTQPISGTVAVSTALALDATLGTTNTEIGGLTETAPATDTASSGLNGRLQRIAQRLTSLIALLPGSLGQKTMAGSLAVTVASDQTAVPASQSGTWTVQPGNTANTTPWLVTNASIAADAATTEPSTVLVAGWDGLNVRASFVQALDGKNTVFVHDPTSRRLLEEILVELRALNSNQVRELGPMAPTQRELQPDQKLVN